VLFIIGMILAPVLAWGLKNTRWGLVLRTVGDSTEAATALGYNVELVRILGTVAGGFLAGMSGQGLMAVALVIFARWNPLYCFYVSLLFGGATALGPALQTVGITSNYYLYGAAPYFLTLALLIYSSSTRHRLAGAPSEVSISR
jgi:simple sugar transport system permease protein